MALAAYQERVVAERDELVDRLVKLYSFIDSAAWQHVPVVEQHRMIAQRTAMELYGRILNDRIAHFGEGV